MDRAEETLYGSAQWEKAIMSGGMTLSDTILKRDTWKTAQHTLDTAASRPAIWLVAHHILEPIKRVASRGTTRFTMARPKSNACCRYKNMQDHASKS